MLSEPKTERRSERHYVAIAKTVHMHDISHILPPLIPEVRQWMMEHGIEATGPDFFLYKSMATGHNGVAGQNFTSSTRNLNPIRKNGRLKSSSYYHRLLRNRNCRSSSDI